MKLGSLWAIAMVGLAGCSSEETQTCESIAPRIIALSEPNAVKILKIYSPKMTSHNAKGIVCRGTALMSDGSDREPIYFRRFIDEEGTAFLEFSKDEFKVTPKD